MSESRVHEHLDRLRRAELPEDARAVADVLDEWLMREHGTTSSHHHVGLFLDLLADEGRAVVPLAEVEELRAEVARLRAGEGDLPPREESACTPLTPAQLLARLDAASPVRRLRLAAAVLDNAETASRCFAMGHDHVKAELDEAHEDLVKLHAENRTLRAQLARHQVPRLAVDGHAYRRRTRRRTRSRR